MAAEIFVIEYNTLFHLLLLKEKAANDRKKAKGKDS